LSQIRCRSRLGSGAGQRFPERDELQVGTVFEAAPIDLRVPPGEGAFTKLLIRINTDTIKGWE
jgi:hypothetical protein